MIRSNAYLFPGLDPFLLEDDIGKIFDVCLRYDVRFKVGIAKIRSFEFTEILLLDFPPISVNPEHFAYKIQGSFIGTIKTTDKERRPDFSDFISGHVTGFGVLPA